MADQSRRLLLLASAALLAAALLPPQAAADGADFCNGIVQNLFRCPVVPTVDTIDLSKYTGRWYAIGNNAQFGFSLFGQQGGQCVTANYTARGVVNGLNTIGVLNRARLTTSVVRQAQSLGLSLSSQAAGLGVKFLCQFLVGQQTLSNITDLLMPLLRGGAAAAAAAEAAAMGEVSRLSHAAAAISQGEIDGLVRAALSALTGLGGLRLALPGLATTPLSIAGIANLILVESGRARLLSAADKAGIASEVARILDAIRVASQTSKLAFDQLEAAQANNFVLSGSNLPTPIATAATAGNISGAAVRVKQLGQDLTASRAAIAASARTIQSIASVKSLQVNAAAAVLAVLAGPKGPLNAAVQATVASAELIRITAGLVRSESPRQRSISANGAATQSPTNAGALSVQFTFAGFTPPGNGAPYNIIKLDGNASTGYDSALVYSCSPSPNSAGLPEPSLYVLSRTPTLPAATVTAALDFAKANGIVLSGPNAFLAVSQNEQLCS